MALTVVTVHGTVLQPVTNVPAVGTVSFNTLIELRDTVDNIVYAPMTFTATLDLNGEFTVVVPATDNPDLTPVNWVYQVWINTDILNEVQYFQIPFDVMTVEFADLVPLDYDPCAGTIGATPIAPPVSDLYVLRAGDTMTGNLQILANLQVSGSVVVGTTLDVGGAVNLANTLNVTGLATFTDVTATDDVTVGDHLQVGGTSTFVGEAQFADGVNVTGDATFNNNVNITGNLAVAGTTTFDDLNVTDDLSVGGDLVVTGTSTLIGLVTANDLNVADDLAVVDDASVGGDLTVTGNTTVTGNITGTDITATNNISAGNNGTFGGSIGVTGVATVGVSVNTPLVVATTGNIVTVNSTNVNATGTVTGSDLTATDDLSVTDDASIGGDLVVTGSGTFGSITTPGALVADSGTFTTSVTAADLVATDDLTVGDDATIAGSLTANDATITTLLTAADLTATDDLIVGDDATIGGDLAVTGTLTTGALSVTGDLLVGDDLTVTDDASIGGDLGVTGTATVTGLLTASNDLLVGDDLTVTDDTQMTGDLNVDGTSTVHYTSTTLNVAQLLTIGLSTCVISGGEITINGGDPAKIDIAAMTGYVVDYNSSDPLSGTNPMVTAVSTAAQIGVTPGFPVSRYFFNSAGVLSQTGTPVTATQRRQMIFIGATVTVAGVVTIDQTLPVIPSQLNNQLVDLMQDMGGFSITGNLISPNGANLSINKTVGTVFTRAFNQIPDYLQPHSSTLAAQTPVNFRHITAVPGGAGAVVTLLNVGFYDPAGLGVVTAVGGGANTSTNFRVWGAANNTVNEQVFIQYGQNTYSSLANAVAALGSGVFVPNPAAAEGTALLGWISVTRTATNLSDPLQATFTKASKFATP